MDTDKHGFLLLRPLSAFSRKLSVVTYRPHASE